VQVVIPPEETLVIDVGLDEYQAVLDGPLSKEDDRSDSYLWQIIDTFTAAAMHPKEHNLPFLRLAGTTGRHVSKKGDSSSVDVAVVPLTFLPLDQLLSALARKDGLSEWVLNPSFRHHLFLLGGLARPSVEFAEGVQRSRDVTKTFNWVFENRVAKKWGQLDQEYLLRLIAESLAGRALNLGSSISVGGGARKTVSRLCENGFCAYNNSRITVPYCVFRLAAACEADLGSEPLKCLRQNLGLLGLIDLSKSVTPDWLTWELFGACFFAMRLNALLITHPDWAKGVTLSRAFSGAQVKGCEQTVLLRPTEVHQTNTQLGPDIPATIHPKTEAKGCAWADVDGPKSYVWVNGESGKGVDVFACLPQLMDDGSVSRLLVLDQRKVEAQSYGRKRLQTLVGKMTKVVPTNDTAPTTAIYAVFNPCPVINPQQQPADIPNLVIVSNSELDGFHAGIGGHPAVLRHIDVNTDNVSRIRRLTSVAAIAPAIVAQRDVQHFSTFAKFETFCRVNNHPLSDLDKARVSLPREIDERGDA